MERSRFVLFAIKKFGNFLCYHDDVTNENIKHFPRYWPFVREIHRSPMNSPHKGQWRGALMFSLICVWINGWVNNRESGDLKRQWAHYYVTVMITEHIFVMLSMSVLLILHATWLSKARITEKKYLYIVSPYFTTNLIAMTKVIKDFCDWPS